jgi:rSAM/selenodomain-associated transferase 2
MVSIVIPVLNEEKNISQLLENLYKLRGKKEIIVVDGGSEDRTVELASPLADVVLESLKGRALQMNAGAKKANGEILWFVHSDSIVEEGSLKAIEESILNGNIGGGFSLYFHDSENFFMKYIAFTSNLRSSFGKLFFGDQGIFIKKECFLLSGGFPNIAIMEDFEFSLIIKKIGHMKRLKEKIGTSSRRFTSKGIFKTFFLMQKMKLLYLMGVPPEKLKKIYREVR